MCDVMHNPSQTRVMLLTFLSLTALLKDKYEAELGGLQPDVFTKFLLVKNYLNVRERTFLLIHKYKF
jgi:hypothetical protein